MELDKEKIEYLKQLPYTTVPLHGKYGKGKYALVDGDFDGAYFNEYTWYISKNGYVVRGQDRSEVVKGRYRTYIYLHREVCRAPAGSWVIFVNQDKLDCRSSNLRALPPKAAIVGYRKPPKQHTRIGTRKPSPSRRKISPYRGVYRGFDSKRWSTMFRGEAIRSFDTPEEAARLYDRLANERWGEDAILNFPEEYLNKQ